MNAAQVGACDDDVCAPVGAGNDECAVYWWWSTQSWLAQRIFIHHIHRGMSPRNTRSYRTGSASLVYEDDKGAPDDEQVGADNDSGARHHADHGGLVRGDMPTLRLPLQWEQGQPFYLTQCAY